MKLKTFLNVYDGRYALVINDEAIPMTYRENYYNNKIISIELKNLRTDCEMYGVIITLKED